MLSITLPPDLESRLRHTAGQLGEDPEAYARRLIQGGLPATTSHDRTLALLKEWDEEDKTSDPHEVDARIAQFEELKATMNATRKESGGPNPRLVFP
jgi:hypothetical protein